MHYPSIGMVIKMKSALEKEGQFNGEAGRQMDKLLYWKRSYGSSVESQRRVTKRKTV